MEHNLPSEPNLREELAAGIAVAAEERGWTSQAKEYRLAAIGAREEHLVAAVGSNSTKTTIRPGGGSGRAFNSLPVSSTGSCGDTANAGAFC